MAVSLIAAALVLAGIGVAAPIVESNNRKMRADENQKKEDRDVADANAAKSFPALPSSKKEETTNKTISTKKKQAQDASLRDDAQEPISFYEPALSAEYARAPSSSPSSSSSSPSSSPFSDAQEQDEWLVPKQCDSWQTLNDENNTEESRFPLSQQANISLTQLTASEQQTETMSQLPPHLRQYVDPTYTAAAQIFPAASPHHSSASSSAENACVSQNYDNQNGPKPYYDYRNRYPDVRPPVNLDGLPAPKLNRTFGNDDTRLGVQGNTIFHPTIPPQARPYPVTGREADNFLRRMTGFDRNPQKKAPVLNPTLIPDGPEGTVPGGGRFLTDQERDAIANLNPNNIGDQMLPFIPVDIRQWQEKPVSYKKPTQLVREPLLPPSNAGQYTVPNNIGLRPLGESSLPTTIGSGDGCGISPHIVDADRYDVGVATMPREPTHGAHLKTAIKEEPVRLLTADEELPIPRDRMPETYTIIRTQNKKLQQPHSLAYGASYAASDDADYDPTAQGNFAVDLSRERSRERASNVAAGVAHGAAAYSDLEVGQSVLPVVGGAPADAGQRIALRTMNATAPSAPGREQDDLIGGGADGVRIDSRARENAPKRRVEHMPMAGVHRVQTDDNAEAGNHADQPGGVSARRARPDRIVRRADECALDDLAYDASGRGAEGLAVRTDEESRKKRFDVRESGKRINLMQNFQAGDAIGGEDGMGGDSAAYDTSLAARAPERTAAGRAREFERQRTATREHGAAFGWNENDEQAPADGMRVASVSNAVRQGAIREQQRLESVDIARRGGDSGIEIDQRDTGGTTQHRDTARAAALRAREQQMSERTRAVPLRADDVMFEDATSSVHRAAAARTGDGIIRAERYGQRRAARSVEAAAQGAKRETFSDENYTQTDMTAPQTSVRTASYAKERRATHLPLGTAAYVADGCETEQATSATVSARSEDNAGRAHRREYGAVQAPLRSGALTTDDLIDAHHVQQGTDKWRDQRQGIAREKNKQMKREDLWRAVLDNEDGQGIADGASYARGTETRDAASAAREMRLDARAPGRYDGIAESADQDAVRPLASVSLRDVEKRLSSAREGRAQGVGSDVHRVDVQAYGGSDEGVADSSAVTMSVSKNLRELMTRHRETTRSNAEMALLRGGDDVEHVYEADRFVERVGTQQQRRDRSWRDETVLQRFGNPDSDVLDNPVMGGTGMGVKADEKVARFLLREQHGLTAPTKGRVDDIEDKFVRYTLDPGTVRVDKPIVGVKEEQRTLALQQRLRCDSPPPENVLKTNARFRAMTSGGRFAHPANRPSTPQPQRGGGGVGGEAQKRRCDSPLYRGTQVCPF